MKLEIILRTHDGKNIHGRGSSSVLDQKRYIPVSKRELVIGCVSSLINSSNLVQNHEIKFTVFDDHSSQELLNELNLLFSQSYHPFKIINLKEKGFNHSALKQFEQCRDSNADLVYSVEDDYLHYPTAINEMINSYVDLKKKYQLNEVCIFPYDTPQEYEYDLNEKFLITRGRNRHWRSTIWTTQTFMTSPKVFQEHWSEFEKLAKEFKVIPKELKHTLDWDNIIWEDTTIGNVWRDYVKVFQPIPSLALHVQFEKERDPFINHLEWWNNFTKIQKPMKIMYQ